jgi:hypothetical protein
VGLDISAVAIERAKAAYPGLGFAVYDVTTQSLNITSDLVVSFDVLIHQTNLHLFCVALGNILAAIGRIGLVSYMTPPLADGRFLPPASLDPASISRAELESERAFCQMTEGLPDKLPRAQTAFHEPLPLAVAALRNDLDVSVAGCYRHQTVYAIRPNFR